MRIVEEHHRVTETDVRGCGKRQHFVDRNMWRSFKRSAHPHLRAIGLAGVSQSRDHYSRATLQQCCHFARSQRDDHIIDGGESKLNLQIFRRIQFFMKRAIVRQRVHRFKLRDFGVAPSGKIIASTGRAEQTKGIGRSIGAPQFFVKSNSWLTGSRE